MADKIIKFPVSYARRMQEKIGRGLVPCMATERWIQFPLESSGYFDEGEFIEISVMTYSHAHDKPRKICDLTVTREDLLRAISAVVPPDGHA
ncbi:MAG: hypothetical protein PVG99_09240 [Desulfobacteraceae bacterium]|jgi:hypothetical protein